MPTKHNTYSKIGTWTQFLLDVPANLKNKDLPIKTFSATFVFRGALQYVENVLLKLKKSNDDKRMQHCSYLTGTTGLHTWAPNIFHLALCPLRGHTSSPRAIVNEWEHHFPGFVEQEGLLSGRCGASRPSTWVRAAFMFSPGRFMCWTFSQTLGRLHFGIRKFYFEIFSIWF